MKKITFYLLIIFVIALILRIIAASNLGYFPDDSNHAVHAINFASSGKLEFYSQSASLWYYVTDIFYKLFGTTHLSARLAAIIFGTMSVFAMFLFAKEFFNKKVGVIAAFLLAISPFLLKFTLSESDAMVLFFLLMSGFLFLKAVKNNNYYKFFVISGVFLGLGIITKVYPLLFCPVFFILGLYVNKKRTNKAFDKKIIKGFILFLVVAFFFAIPTLTNNYLLYKDKGYMNYLFSNTLKVGGEQAAALYSWDAGWGKSHEWLGFFIGHSESLGIEMPTSIYCMKFLAFSDPLVFVLGLIGLIYCFFKRRDFFIFFAAGFFFVFFYLATIIPLSKHFLFLLLFFIPPAALMLSKISTKVLKIAIPLILLFNLFFLGLGGYLPTPFHFYGQSATAKVMDFKDKNIQDNDLIVADSRIYRGTIHWAFNGKPYMEGTYFIQALNAPEQIPGDPIQIDVFYFECVLDDCGWGTVHKQPEFNQSMEMLTDWFKQNAILVSEFDEPHRYKSYYPLVGEKRNIFKVYHANLVINSGIIPFASQPKDWFLNTIGFIPKDKQFDYYEVNGFFDKSLDYFAHFIVLLSVALAFLSPIYVIHLTFRREEVK